MSIILVRVDDRLIHGQIIEGWLKPLKAKQILVVSDEVARDKMQKTLLGMAVPSNIKFNIFSIEESVKKINDGYLDKEPAIILVSSPKDIVSMLNLGIKFKSVNIGGMYYAPGKTQILKTLSVDEADISNIMEINKRGIELEGRVLPSDDKIDIVDVINRGVKK